MLLVNFVFKIFMYLLLLLIVAKAVHYLLVWYSQYQRLPKASNVMKYLKSIQSKLSISDQNSESEVENILARSLQNRFGNVTTQALVGGKRYARERIDIDLGDGQLGIEIKLADMLRKSNERNRLLGQIDLYLERKYTPENLLILIIGKNEYAQTDNIQEIQRMIKNKKVYFYYIKTN